MRTGIHWEARLLTMGAAASQNTRLAAREALFLAAKSHRRRRGRGRGGDDGDGDGDAPPPLSFDGLPGPRPPPSRPTTGGSAAALRHAALLAHHDPADPRMPYAPPRRASRS